MNKNTTISIIVAAVAVVAIVLIVVFAKKAPVEPIVVPAVETNQSVAPAIKATDTPGAPVVRTNESVVPADTTATVSGTIVPTGAMTSYWFEYGTTPSLGSTTGVVELGSGYSKLAVTAKISGLVKNTQYYFRLVAENKYGKVPGVPYGFKTINGPAGAQPVVTTGAVSATGRTVATLNGQVTPHNAETNYWFEYGTTSDMGTISKAVNVGAGNSIVAVSLSLENLDPATLYYYTIVARNQFGTTYGKVSTFSTDGPPVPSAPLVTTKSAKDITETRAMLQGEVNPKSSETTYWFEYSTDSLLGSALLKTTPQTAVGKGNVSKNVTASITSLTKGATYYYRLVAQNGYGIVRGDKVSFKTASK